MAATESISFVVAALPYPRGRPQGSASRPRRPRRPRQRPPGGATMLEKVTLTGVRRREREKSLASLKEKEINKSKDKNQPFS